MAKKPNGTRKGPAVRAQNDQKTVDDSRNDPDLAPLEVSLEDLEELIRDEQRDLELAVDGPVDTQHSDGSAYYSHAAQEQGLVYTPPDDPPVLPGDDLQGVEMGAGFGKALEEEDDPRAEVAPTRVHNQDADLEDKIKSILRKSSETAHLDDIEVTVDGGIVYLSGTVETLDDVDVVGYLIQDIAGVVDIEENLEVTIL